MAEASGLAGKVRRAKDSDEFDLGGYDQSRCNDFVKSTFTEPFPVSAMIRHTFVVGAGKLGRQKYGDDLPKFFMNALSSIGFTEDNGAVCEAGSAGKFKYQHDTSKNLKYVHVFPRITGPKEEVRDDDEEEEEESDSGSPEDTLFACDDKTFLRLVTEYVSSYSQKKVLLDKFRDRVAKLEELDNKMMRREQLSADEQKIFEGASADELKEKMKILTGELQKMVDGGLLTSQEKTVFLEQLEEKLTALSAELTKAEADGKTKRAQALTEQREKVEKTRKSVKDADAASLPPLRHASEIRKLRTKLAEILRIEKASSGRYTIDELKRIGDKPELEEAIGVLETRSRGWFEDDEVFQARLDACLRAGPGKKSAAGSGGYAGAGRAPAAPAASSFKTIPKSKGAAKSKGKSSGPATKNAFASLDDD